MDSDVKGSVRRQEIFAIAAEIFYQKGYAQTSTRDIAEAAGILKGSLYAHISSKEDILYAIIEEIHHSFELNVAACEQLRDQDPLDQLGAFLAGHMRVALSLLKHHQIYNRDWRSLSQDRFLAIRGKRAAYEKYLAGLLRGAQQAGRLRDGTDCRLQSLALLSALNSVHTWYRADGEFTVETVAETYCSMVMDGIVVRE